MSDNAFKSAPFAGYTTAQLWNMVDGCEDKDRAEQMSAEIFRRDRVAAGDRSVMTDGEKLRGSK